MEGETDQSRSSSPRRMPNDRMRIYRQKLIAGRRGGHDENEKFRGHRFLPLFLLMLIVGERVTHVLAAHTSPTCSLLPDRRRFFLPVERHELNFARTILRKSLSSQATCPSKVTISFKTSVMIKSSYLFRYQGNERHYFTRSEFSADFTRKLCKVLVTKQNSKNKQLFKDVKHSWGSRRFVTFLKN